MYCDDNGLKGFVLSSTFTNPCFMKMENDLIFHTNRLFAGWKWHLDGLTPVIHTISKERNTVGYNLIHMFLGKEIFMLSKQKSGSIRGGEYFNIGFYEGSIQDLIKESLLLQNS